MIELLALAEMLREYSLDGAIERYLPMVLQQRGRLAALLSEIRGKAAISAQIGDSMLVPADAGIELEELLVWYEQRFRPLKSDLNTHAIELGFRSDRELISELTAQYLVERDTEHPRVSHV